MVALWLFLAPVHATWRKSPQHLLNDENIDKQFANFARYNESYVGEIRKMWLLFLHEDCAWKARHANCHCLASTRCQITEHNL